MPADPTLDTVRFVFDEDSRGFGLWLARLRRDMACVGSPPVDELLPLGILDPDWIPVVAERGWIAITKNHRIRTQPTEASLAVKHGLRVACLMEPNRNADRWDFSRAVFRHWDAIDELSTRTGATWLAVQSDRTRMRPFAPGTPERSRDGRL